VQGDAAIARPESERETQIQESPMSTSSNVPPLTPDPILKLGTGFMAAKHLFAAVELGLFEKLAERRTLDELTAALSIPRRTARICVDAMVAVGLVRRDQDHYVNGPEAQAFLSGQGPIDLRPWARFWNRISYGAWQGLDQTLRTGVPANAGRKLTPEQEELFSKGVAAITAGSAHALAAKYDLARHERVLDLGGGTGSFLTAMLAKHPRLGATLFEQPATAEVARKLLAGTPHGANIEIVAGDLFTSPLPTGHDLVLLANVVHYFTPSKNLELLRRIRGAMAPRARVLVVDFWMNATHSEPVFGALMAGEFAVLIPDGDVYSLDEGSAWLADAGFRAVEHLPLAGPTSCLIAEAV
jgi:SAM-dependent methyltransferase